MKKILHKLKVLYGVLIGESITISKQNNELVVEAGDYSTKYIREVASEFFKSAYLLDNKKNFKN